MNENKNYNKVVKKISLCYNIAVGCARILPCDNREDGESPSQPPLL